MSPLGALDINLFNKSRVEVKEQHLPRSYSHSLDKSISGGEILFSLLEAVRIENKSVFYLKYLSNNPFSLFLSGREYLMPASDEPLYASILLQEKSVIDKFTIITPEGSNGVDQLIECGIISGDGFQDITGGFNILFFDEDSISLSFEDLERDENISLTFYAEKTSPIGNISLSLGEFSTSIIKTRAGSNQYWFYGSSYEKSINSIEIKSTRAFLEKILFNQIITDGQAIPVDLEEFVYWDRLLWRDDSYEIFRWDLFPGMLLIDTESYEIQSNFFKRIAFFTEKKNTAGQLLGDAEIESLHGWNAHDYKADDLARFFNEAETTGFKLNDYELLLKEILIDNAVLGRTGKRVRPLDGGILSISRESTERLRWLFLTHEGYHGVFFSSDEYIFRVREIWNALSGEEKDFWRIFLDLYGYNVIDEYLLINEFQAYLMQQDISLADSYFRSKINWITSIRPNLKPTMDHLLSEYGDTFSRSAAAVENAAYSLTGIKAGDLVLKRKK